MLYQLSYPGSGAHDYGSAEKQSMQIRTAKLEGVALDWAVHQAIPVPGVRVVFNEGSGQLIAVDKAGWSGAAAQYSTDWESTGPLIDPFRLDIEFNRAHVNWGAYFITDRVVLRGSGPTPLIAICRCIVSARLGDVVNVPDELCAIVAQSGQNAVE